MNEQSASQRLPEALGPGHSVVTVAIVANDVLVREQLARLVEGDSRRGAEPRLLVVASISIDRALESIRSHAPDMLIAHADTDAERDALCEIAEIAPAPFFVLVVSDLDVPAADGRILNRVAVVHPRRIEHVVPRLLVAAADDCGRSDRAALITREQARLEELTPRERQVLSLTAEGLSMKEIAQAFDRSEATVAKHRDNLMKKLELHDKVALTRFAIRTGLTEA